MPISWGIKKIRKLARFPALDLLVMCLSVVYVLVRPCGAFEQRQMLEHGVRAEAQVTNVRETVFGTFVDYSFISQGGSTVKGTIEELDISRYGLSHVIPQTVEVTYLPDELDFVWLGHMEGQLETFWIDFFKVCWMNVLFNYALWMILLRMIISNMDFMER